MDNHYKQVSLKGKEKELAELFWQLKDKKVVVVLTDKMNNCVTVTLDEFHGWVTKHLNKNAVEMKRKDIVRIRGEAEAFAAKVKLLLTKNEQDFLQEGIAYKAIPQPQLLVKDRKEPEEDGSFPTRLVIPATNFTATFLKLGYLGIKKIWMIT
eukprot:5756855-Ditylum_brightwellii.AAC.1